MNTVDQTNGIYHQRPEECTVDPKTKMCTVCGVDHSRECPDCHRHGFHSDTCFLWEPPTVEHEYRPSFDELGRRCLVQIGYVVCNRNHQRVAPMMVPLGFVTRFQAEQFIRDRDASDQLHVVEKQIPTGSAA